MRLQNFANEEFGSTGLWAGFGKKFLKPIGLNETKEMLVEKFEQVPIKKTYTCNPQEYGYLDQPQNKLRVPMHYVLKNDKDNHLGAAPLQYGKVRIFIEGSGEHKEQSTAFLGEDWGKFTPIDDEMKLYLGVAQDIVVKRTIDKNDNRRVAGNLFNHEVVAEVRDRELQGPAGHARRGREPAARAERGPRRQRPRRAMGAGQGHELRRAGRTRRRARSSSSCSTSSCPPATRTARPRRSSRSSTSCSRTNGESKRTAGLETRDCGCHVDKHGSIQTDSHHESFRMRCIAARSCVVVHRAHVRAGAAMSIFRRSPSGTACN